MSGESKRLFFGNPTVPVDVKPMPQGQRLCFGSPQPEPAKAPAVNPSSTVLCFGNHPLQPQPDTPFQVVNNKLEWSERPKA